MANALILRIHERDNVAVALEDIAAGTTVVLPDGTRLAAATDVPYSHKVALTAIKAGAPVIKYGEVIGRAACHIAPGEWVHTHNLESPDPAAPTASTTPQEEETP